MFPLFLVVVLGIINELYRNEQKFRGVFRAYRFN